VPSALGNVYVVDPAAAAAWNLTEPLEEPLIANMPLRFVVAPDAAPILIVVAAPAKLTVVAVVFTKSKLVLGVVRLVVIAGLVMPGVVPKLVRLELVTPLPNVVLVNTLVPLISYPLPVTTFMSSLDVNAVALFNQVKVLSVVPFIVIPPPLAVISVAPHAVKVYAPEV